MKLGAVFAAGLVAGIVIVVACQHGGGSAGASPADCTTWQYTSTGDGAPTTRTDLYYVDKADASQSYPIQEISGWEPFAVNLSSSVYFRRCKP